MNEQLNKIREYVEDRKEDIMVYGLLFGLAASGFVLGRSSARTIQEVKATATKDGVVIEEFHRIIIK